MTGLFLHKQLAGVEDFPSVNSNICSIGLPTLNKSGAFSANTLPIWWTEQGSLAPLSRFSNKPTGATHIWLAREGYFLLKAAGASKICLALKI